MAEVARESISAASNAAVDFVATATSRPQSVRSPSLQLTRNRMGRSATSGIADATTTKVNVISDVVSPKKNAGNLFESPKSPKEQAGASAASNAESAGDALKKPAENGEAKGNSETETTAKVLEQPKSDVESTSKSNSGWLDWFTKPGSTNEKAQESPSTMPQVALEEPDLTKPTSAAKPAGSAPSQEAAKPTEPISAPKVPETMGPLLVSASNSQKRSWLQMWGGTSSEKSDSGSEAPSQDISVPNGSATSAAKPSDLELPELDKPSATIEASAPPPLGGDGSKTSGWVFWSREKQDRRPGSTDEAHIGEIAISGESSQNRPKRASISSPGPSEVAKELKKPSKAQPKAKEATESRPATPVAKDSKAKAVDLSSKTTTPGKSKPLDGEASKQLQKTVPNQVLPSFKDTFAPQENPSWVQQLSRLLNYTKLGETRHVHRIRDPPRIKSAIAIGVHGYFPAPFLRSVLGQPTGTSIKFADMAAQAIRKWTDAHGYECNVKTAALEGEGRIAERVDLLWKLLLNWIDEIRKADFILIACHSQGVPVAMMLVAKLISFGCVSSAKVGACAMAGVNMGPFPDYKSRFISGSAAELFDFSDPQSLVSQDYLAALETAVKFGVRVLYVGSIDDQLVPMEVSPGLEYCSCMH